MPGTDPGPDAATAALLPAAPNRSAAPVIIGLVLVVALAVGIFFLLTSDSDDTPDAHHRGHAGNQRSVTQPPVTEAPVTVPPMTEPAPTTALTSAPSAFT